MLKLRRLARLPQTATMTPVGQRAGERQTKNLAAGLEHFADGLGLGGGIQNLWHAPILKDDRAPHDFGFAGAGRGAAGAAPGVTGPGCRHPARLQPRNPARAAQSHPEEPRSAADQEALPGLDRAARARRTAAYITGRREFWTLELQVTRDVLVPRPETELLVERGLALCSVAAAQVLDLGTGSGAIALSLAAERPAWQVLAIDASPAALAVARDNGRRLGLTAVAFEPGDWFSGLAGRRFDLVAQQSPLRGCP